MRVLCQNGKVRQLFAGFTGGLCLVVVGNWAGWASPFLHKLQLGEIPFNLTQSELSWVVSLPDFGTIISPIPAGYLMDWIGRKKSFFLTAIIYEISWILVIIANGAKLLCGARLLSGLAQGIIFTIIPMYFAEIAETKIRGAISGLFTILLFIGVLFELTIGLYVPYETANIISSIVPLIFFVCAIIIPESPHYFLMKNKYKEAYKSLTWLRNPQNKTSQNGERSIEKEYEETKAQVKKEMENRGRWLDLIGTKGAKRATTVVMTLSVMQRFSGTSTMLSYMSTTLPNIGESFGPEQCTIIFSSLLLVTSIVCMFIVDWLGRKPTLFVSGIVCAIIQGVTAYYFYLDSLPGNNTANIQWIPYANMLIFAVFYQAGVGIMSHTLLGEMFPSNIKSKAAATATICFALSSFVLNKIFLTISGNYGVYTMFILFAVSNLSISIFTYFFVIETKGKTFGEIQEILNK